MHEFVSIIIPTFNEEQHIGRCLDSLMNLNYPREKLEIVVVDNGSRDTTVEILKKYKTKVLINQKGTISQSRNLGATHAQGEILAFIDGDCIASPDWLENAVTLFKNREIGAVGCWYKLPPRPSLTEKIWDIHTSRRMKAGYTDWIPSSNFIIRRNVFEVIGGFKDFLVTSEDVDICDKVRKNGMKVYSDPRLSLVHLDNPKNIKEFFIKEMWRGGGVMQNFLQSFPGLKFNKALLFALSTLFFVLNAIIGIVIWYISGNISLFLLSIIALAFIPLCFSIQVMMQHRQWRYFFHLMFLFFIFGISRALSLLNFRVWVRRREECLTQ